MSPATSEVLSKAIRKAKRIKIVQGGNMEEKAAMAMFLDSSPKGGYIQAIREVIKRKLANTQKYFQIAVLDMETNLPISDVLHGRQLAAQTNMKLKATNSPVRVRWISTDAEGMAVNKLLAIPVEKYRESGGIER